MTQTEFSEPTGATQRMRRYRQRKRQGVICMVQAPVYCRDVEELVTYNRLTLEDQNNTAKIAEVVETLVDDFTQARLIPVK